MKSASIRFKIPLDGHQFDFHGLPSLPRCMQSCCQCFCPWHHFYFFLAKSTWVIEGHGGERKGSDSRGTNVLSPAPTISHQSGVCPEPPKAGFGLYDQNLKVPGRASTRTPQAGLESGSLPQDCPGGELRLQVPTMWDLPHF